jgi:hypothetical protein
MKLAAFLVLTIILLVGTYLNHSGAYKEVQVMIEDSVGITMASPEK